MTTQHLSRRRFLQGACGATAAFAGSTLLSGCTPSKPTNGAALASTESEATSELIGMQTLRTNREFSFFEPPQGRRAFIEEPIASNEISDTLECDLLVCGAGLAGVCTALSAADAGLDVIVIEKTENGNFRGSEIGVLNGEYVKSQGVTFNEADYLNTALQDAQYRCNPLLWQTLIANCGIAADWLIEISKDKLTPVYPQPINGSNIVVENGIATYRDQLRFKEGRMVDVGPILISIAEEKGVSFQYSTPAVQLVQNDQGAVTGAIAKNSRGEFLQINSKKGVALCTGGYENDWEMLRESVREEDLVIGSWGFAIQNTGDGIKMGVAAGATIDGYPHVLMRDPGGAVKSHNAGATGVLGLSWPRVNENGLRFVNECLAVNLKANAIAQQVGGHCWCIFAGPDPVTAFSNTNYREDTSIVATWEPDHIINDILLSDIQVFDSIEELASTCGINLDNLKKTIDELQVHFETGVDATWGADNSFAFDWTSGPYYAMEEAGSALATVSGLTVNELSEVLDGAQKPIGNLYAIGNVSGAMFANTYPHELSGVSHGRCLTFGYLLGQRLANI